MTGPLINTRTQRVVLSTPDNPLRMRMGGQLDNLQVVFETYGELNAAKDNAIFICHALTGDAHAAGISAETGKRGWWDNFIGPGKVVDTDKFFVISPNLLGGCSGTTGPLSINPATGSPYYLDFPMLHMSDMVAPHSLLLDHLGIDRLYAAVGGSLGGMQVLQWVIDEPDRIDKAVVIAASSRLTTENIAFSAVGRHAIMTDPDFRGGRYAEYGVQPRLGQKVARMMAHITYVAAESLELKFGRQRRAPEAGWRFDPDFEVEHYLEHQGETFLERFDALSYIYLTRLLDYFDPFAEEGTAAALQSTKTKFQVTSFSSDWRFSTQASQVMVGHLTDLGVTVDFAEIASPYGHDSFLLQPPGYHERVAQFLHR